MLKKKFILATTIPESLIFFRNQLAWLNDFFEVHAVSSNEVELLKIGEAEGILTYEIPMKRETSLFSDLWCLFLFMKLFFRLRPHIVHGNTPKAALLSMVAAWLTRVPNRIYMCHGLRYQGSSGVSRYILKKMEVLTCRCATKVFCVSQGVYETLKNDRICSVKTSVVLNGSSNGINMDYFSASNIGVTSQIREKHNIPEHSFIFCFIGRLTKDKGIHELISAFQRFEKKYPDTYLLLVGPEENIQIDSIDYKQVIRNNQKIIQVGMQKDVRPYLATSDTLLLSSYREGFGMVLIEAGAMGIPSIASNISGCNNIIIEGTNGLLINPRDEESLYNAMERIYSDDELRNHIKTHTRKSISDRFEQKMVWEAYLNEYLKS